MIWLWQLDGSSRETHPCLRCRPRLEELEPRELPAALTPIQVRHAYGFDQVSFSVDGETIRADGSGQTIAIVVAYKNPRLIDDLDTFSQYFSLEPGGPTLYEEYGPASSYLTIAQPQGKPKRDPGGLWALEAALDVQWAHAIAPGADILLVQAKTSGFKHMMRAVAYARKQPGVSVISMSWGSVEFPQQGRFNSRFTTPADHLAGSDGRGGPLLPGGITFVAASGDSGKPGLWPGVSRNVVAVGGTRLTVDAYGNYQDEVAWKKSGGGVSAYQAKPPYQQHLPPQRRAGPDVAYNGAPGTGFYVYHTMPIKGRTSTWWSVGGTSAGAPQWAALFAIANQGRALQGLGALDGRGQTLPALYQMPSENFNDIVSGSNGRKAKPGFDLVTGHGTPRAAAVIADLVAYEDGAILPGTVSPLARAAAPAIGPVSRPFHDRAYQTSVGWHVAWLKPGKQRSLFEPAKSLRPLRKHRPAVMKHSARVEPAAPPPRVDAASSDVDAPFMMDDWLDLTL